MGGNDEIDIFYASENEIYYCGGGDNNDDKIWILFKKNNKEK